MGIEGPGTETGHATEETVLATSRRGKLSSQLSGRQSKVSFQEDTKLSFKTQE